MNKKLLVVLVVVLVLSVVLSACGGGDFVSGSENLTSGISNVCGAFGGVHDANGDCVNQ